MDNGMEVKQVAEIYATTIIEAFPHIGRCNPCITLPKEVSEHRRLSHEVSDTEKTFVQENLTHGKLYLLPDEERQLRKIEEQARFNVKKRLLVFDYLLYENYESLAKVFDKKKAEYFALRDQIAEVWDERMVSFSRGLSEYLRGCGFTKEDVAKIHKDLMRQLPTKDSWLNSFSFSLEVRTYPAMPGSLPGMDEKWEERTRDLQRSILTKQLTDLFDKTLAVLDNLIKGKNCGRRIAALTSEAGRCLNHRILSDNDILNTAKEVLKISVDQSEDEVADRVEKALSNIIKLADKYDVFLDMTNCPVSKEYLLSVGAEQLTIDMAQE